MRGLKIFNGINGSLYSIYGIIGVFSPLVVFNANAIEQVGVHGSHSIRALWGGICVLGIFILLKGLTPETTRSTTFIVTFVSIGLVTARLFGVFVDGTEGMFSDQFGPLFIESTMSVVGLILLGRSKPY